MSKKENKQFLKEEHYLYILSGLVITTAIGLLGWFVYQFTSTSKVNLQKSQDKQVVKEEIKQCDHRRKLDGVCVSNPDDENPKLISVMIENHVNSRPPSGLSEARVVYEAPVEGNINRFLALYNEKQEIEKVGPVRSARPYFVDWVREYGDILYAHVGGSPAALGYIDKIGINDLDEFSRGWYFWRSNGRDKPHDAYTSSELWNKALEDYSELYKNQDYEGWRFSETDTCKSSTSTSCINEIKVSFSEPYYSATWNYNSSSQKYDRYQVGDMHQDKDGDLIQADTVIVQYVDTTVVDNVGRLDMETVGSGKAEIFMKGKKISGEWKKEDKKSRTKFYNEDREEITLNPGQIWVEVVNQRASVSY